MSTKQTEALKLALEALEKLNAEKSYWWQEVEIDTVEAIEKAESICKEALAEQPYPDNFIDALKYDVAKRDSEALAEQPAQQEPVEYWTVADGWVSEQAEVPAFVWVEPDFWEHCKRVNCGTAYRLPAPGRQPLYTSPPASKPWVGLTDEDLSVCDEDGVMLARYWERVLREKNNG